MYEFRVCLYMPITTSTLWYSQLFIGSDEKQCESLGDKYYVLGWRILISSLRSEFYLRIPRQSPSLRSEFKVTPSKMKILLCPHVTQITIAISIEAVYNYESLHESRNNEITYTLDLNYITQASAFLTARFCTISY